MPKAAAPRTKPKAKAVPPPAVPSYSFTQLVQEYALFLEIAIQSLLHLRSIYPSQSFLRRNKTWGKPAKPGVTGPTPSAASVHCWASRHEGVREFVGRSIEKGLGEIAEGRASRLVLVLLRDRETPLERWIFSFDDLHRLGLTSAQRRDQHTLNGPTPQMLAMSFKTAYVQIVTIAGTLDQLDLTDDAQFTLLIEHAQMPLPTASADSDGGAVSQTLATDSESLRRRKGLVQAPDALSTAVLQQEQEESQGDAYRGKWVKAIRTGILDMEVSVQELGPKQERVPVKVDLKGKGRAID